MGIDPSADFPFIPALQALAAGRAPLLLAGAGWGVLPFRLPAADFALGTRGTGGQDCSSPAPDGQREDESGRLSPAFLSFVAKDRDVPG